ncbi:hypothetical protein GCM10020295_26140 [Streptomyces cinereospinus]
MPSRPPGPPPRLRRRDPPAVALGNASLLGVGHLLTGRRGLAATAAPGTAVPAWALASTAWWGRETAALVRWAAVVAHGWFVASRGTARAASRGRRPVALGVTRPVLPAAGLPRYDAARIAESVGEARDRGDCAGLCDAQDGVRAGHRLADAPSGARGDEAVEDGRRLETAGVLLDSGPRGDTEASEKGFGILAEVLPEPGNERTARAVLDGFLAKACPPTAPAAGWLVGRSRRPRERGHRTGSGGRMESADSPEGVSHESDRALAAAGRGVAGGVRAVRVAGGTCCCPGTGRSGSARAREPVRSSRRCWWRGARP